MFRVLYNKYIANLSLIAIYREREENFDIYKMIFYINYNYSSTLIIIQYRIFRYRIRETRRRFFFFFLILSSKSTAKVRLNFSRKKYCGRSIYKKLLERLMCFATSSFSRTVAVFIEKPRTFRDD